MRSRIRKKARPDARPQKYTYRLLEEPEQIGYRPRDKSLIRFRFGYSPCAVAQDWFWAYLAVSYTMQEKYIHVGAQDRKKLYFAFVREQLLQGQHKPGVGIDLELAADKHGKRFRNGVPYRLEEIDLYAPFEVSIPSPPTAARKKSRSSSSKRDKGQSSRVLRRGRKVSE